MATIKNFEELKAWQKARELAGYVYELTRKEKFARDYALSDQIQRAASSAMHNIAEEFESGPDPEFVRRSAISTLFGSRCWISYRRRTSEGVHSCNGG